MAPTSREQPRYKRRRKLSGDYFAGKFVIMHPPSEVRPNLDFELKVRPRLEDVFYALSKGSDYLEASKLAHRLQKYHQKLRLTSRERAHLLLAADLRKGQLISKYDFMNLLSKRIMTQNSAWIRRTMFQAADVIAMPGSRRDPVTLNYEARYSCKPPPVFILAITLAEIAVYVYYCLNQHVVPTWTQGCPGCRDSPLTFDPQFKKEAWRYFTYVFIHAGIGHIVMNLIVQLVVGVPLEMVHKMWRIAPIYIAGAIVAAMLQNALDPHVTLVGASGAGYAILVAHASSLVLNWSEMSFRWYRLIAIAIFVTIDVGTALYTHYEACEPDISHLGHVGGAVTGFLLGIVMLRNLRRHRWEKYFQIFCGMVFLAFVAALIVLNVIMKPDSKIIWDEKCPK